MALRAELPVAMVRERAERTGMLARLADINILPHGGGYAYTQFRGVRRVIELEDRRYFEMEPSGLLHCPRVEASPQIRVGAAPDHSTLGGLLQGWRFIRQTPLVRYMVIASVVMVLMRRLLQFSLGEDLEAIFADEASLRRYIANYMMIASAAAFVLQALVAGPVLAELYRPRGEGHLRSLLLAALDDPRRDVRDTAYMVVRGILPHRYAHQAKLLFEAVLSRCPRNRYSADCSKRAAVAQPAMIGLSCLQRTRSKK